MKLPESGEYNPYFDKYIQLVPAGEFLEVLKENTSSVIGFFDSIPMEKHLFRYAADKWTCKEVLMHIIDTERVMSYRALVAMRGDADTLLAPVDENLYARNVDVSNRSMKDLLLEFEYVRKATTKLFEYITPAQSMFLGNGQGHPISPRAVGYIMIGHTLHHMNIVSSRYLSS